MPSKNNKNQYKGPMLLVGFGKYDLKDLVKFIGTPWEGQVLEAPLRAPARYRRPNICQKEEFEAFTVYLNWITDKLGIDPATGKQLEQ